MKKTALIIGNSKYENVSQLKNPTNDSFDIKTALEGIGFDVVYDENLSLKKFNKIVKSFECNLNPHTNYPHIRTSSSTLFTASK